MSLIKAKWRMAITSLREVLKRLVSLALLQRLEYASGGCYGLIDLSLAMGR